MITLNPDTTESAIHTIARCFKELIINKDIDAALKNIVGWLANSLNIDRCYISEAITKDGSGSELMSVQAGSGKAANGVAKHARDIILNTTDFPEIHSLLESNLSFKVSVEDEMSPALFDFLQIFELKSLLLIPLFSGKTYWGFIGFGDTQNPHTWRHSEADLKSLAVAIGVAIESDHTREVKNVNQLAFELGKQKDQYQFLVQSLGQAVFTINAKGILSCLNDAWQTMLGYSPEECIGNNFLHYMPEEEIRHFWENFGGLLSNTQKTFDRQMQMLHKNGEKIWVRIIAKSTKDQNNQVSGVFGSIENINSQFTSDVLLKESNDKLNTILNNSKEIILTIDLGKNQIENVNDAIGILGYKPEDWVGQSYKSFSENQRKTFHELMKLAVKSQLQVQNQQISFSNKNNTEIVTFEFSTSLFTFKQSKYLLCVLRDMRERVGYEQNISKISNQLTHLINNIDDVYAIYDLPSKQFEFVSNNVEGLYGCTKEEFVKHALTWNETIHLEDIPGIEKSLESILQTETKGELFYRISTPTGEVKMVFEKITVGKNESGKAEKLYIVKTDYTHIENIERSLIESEKKFRFISENISDFISIHDPDWNFTYASPSVETILGYEPGDIVGLGGFDLVHPEDLHKTLDELLEPLVLEHKETQLRYRLKASDGNYKWVETYSKPVLDFKGETTSIISSTRDVTDQVDAENMLRTSEEQYRLLSENSNDVIAIYNLKGEFLYVSPSSFQVLGYAPVELVGKTPADVLAKDRLEKDIINNSIAQIIEDRTSQTYIYKATTKNGEVKWLEAVVQPVIKNNEVVSIQAASRDVTERENLLLELEQSLEKERELNELRAMFVATASHQFRTPLTVIQSGVEIMEMYLEDLPPEKQVRFQKQFGKIQVEVERLEFLMSDILLLGRANAARTPFNPEPDDIVAFTRHILDDKYNNRYPEERKVLLNVSGEPVMVDFDPKLLGHAIENIISNAYKYSEHGNLEVHITFNAEMVQLAISDKGIGIPLDDQKNLFQPFYRATNTNEIDGTGLGLAIVKEFIDKHNGEIFLTSKVNKGTTVNVIIPVKQKSF
jgi:PAS domain S-box-containing protein